MQLAGNKRWKWPLGRRRNGAIYCRSAAVNKRLEGTGSCFQAGQVWAHVGLFMRLLFSRAGLDQISAEDRCANPFCN